LTDTTLPDPLVPAEVDLQDFQGMWVDTDRLLRSDTWRGGTGDQKAAAMTLWLESWHQVPAASLPSNDRLLANLSQAERWPRCREHALRGWIACADGRLYHPVVAEKALEAWIEKLAAAISGAAGNAKRWQVEIDTTVLREQLRRAADMLRTLNPTARTFKKKAVVVILAGSQPDSGGESQPQSQPESPPDGSKASPPDRKGPDRTGPDRTRTEQRVLSAQGEAVGPGAPTPAGAAVLAMKAQGLTAGISPSHPKLLALLEAGITHAELADAAADAVSKGKPFAYALATAEGRRRDAATQPLPARRTGHPSPQSTADRNAEAKRLLGFNTPTPEELPHA
jgi:hypothetical protein